MTEVVSLHQKTNAGYCLTPTARAITALLSVCQKSRLMGAIVGATGTGKSTSIANYLEDHDDSVLCRMTQASRSLQPAYIRLHQALIGYASFNAGAAELYERIVDYLGYLGGDGLLILDECQHLNTDALEGIRDLYDEAKIGILVGDLDLSKKYNDLPQLRGRIMKQFERSVPSDGDINAICNHHKITDNKSRGLINRAAKLPGHLHNVGNLIRVAKGMAGQDEKPGPDHFKQAVALMGWIL